MIGLICVGLTILMALMKMLGQLDHWTWLGVFTPMIALLVIIFIYNQLIQFGRGDQ